MAHFYVNKHGHGCNLIGVWVFRFERKRVNTSRRDQIKKDI